MRIPNDAHWRDSARTPMFFVINANSVFPLALWLVHIRLWTFIVAISFITFFAILEKFKFTPTVFKHWLRNFIAAGDKIALPWWRE